MKKPQKGATYYSHTWIGLSTLLGVKLRFQQQVFFGTAVLRLVIPSGAESLP